MSEHPETTITRDFERGAWFAFDAVLSWINTQTERTIDKHALYRAVMDLRPQALADLERLRQFAEYAAQVSAGTPLGQLADKAMRGGSAAADCSSNPTGCLSDSECAWAKRCCEARPLTPKEAAEFRAWEAKQPPSLAGLLDLGTYR